MKIKIKETTTTEREVDISLPAFRKEKDNYNPSFFKIISEDEYIQANANQSCFGINYYQLSGDKFFSNKYEDCTEEEFMQKADECAARIVQLLPVEAIK